MPLSPATRRGTTVVELLIALGLVLVLTLIVGSVLRRTQDTYRAAAQRMDRRQSLRIAATFLPAELRELDAPDGDIVAMSPTAVTVRAPRQFAVLCRAQPAGPPGLATLVVAARPRYGLREFAADTDSLWVLSELLTWVPGDVVSLGSGSCADGSAGRQLTVALTATDRLPLGTPVLGFETVTYRLYRSSSDGRWYVGQQTTTDLQPVLGPVPSDGLSFTYLDSSGAVTTVPAQVSLIEVRVRAATIEPIRDVSGRLGRPVDSVVTVIALRNNRHGE